MRSRTRRRPHGGGPVVSFELVSADRARAVARSLELFPLTVSFGAVGSSVCHPHAMSHASIPPELRAMAPPEELLRLSIGLEAAADLGADLARAIAGASGVDVPCTGAERSPMDSILAG